MSELLEVCLESYGVPRQGSTDEQMHSIINKLSSLCKAWVKDSRIVPFGSFSLGTQFSDSDLDLVLVAPKRVQRTSFQNQLLETLRQDPEVLCCQGIFTAKVPLIKLVFKEVEVDLLFANTDSTCLSKDLSDCDYQSLLTLNGYRNSKFLLKLVPDKQKFQKVLRAVKLWATKRSIYSNCMGYLGGFAWALLVGKICIEYSRLSVPFLVGKFFEYYKNWDWRVCVSLVPSMYKQRSVAPMTILTLASPVYNAAYTLTYTNFMFIQQEFELAYEVSQRILTEGLEWKSLFAELEFFDVFEYFLKIEVVGRNLEEFTKLKGSFLSQLRYLVEEIENSYLAAEVSPYTKHFKASPYSSVYFVGINCFRNPRFFVKWLIKDLKHYFQSPSINFYFLPKASLT